MNRDAATYEVREGRLLADGRPLPLNKGLILLALYRAGWKGAEGLLSGDLTRRLLAADPRIAIFSTPRSIAG